MWFLFLDCGDGVHQPGLQDRRSAAPNTGRHQRFPPLEADPSEEVSRRRPPLETDGMPLLLYFNIQNVVLP